MKAIVVVVFIVLLGLLFLQQMKSTSSRYMVKDNSKHTEIQIMISQFNIQAIGLFRKITYDPIRLFGFPLPGKLSFDLHFHPSTIRYRCSYSIFGKYVS